MKKWIRADIVEMKPYTPIVPFEVLSRRLGRAPDDIVKLDANENPYGSAPKAVEHIKSGAFFHIYPDPSATQLVEALGDYLDMPTDHLIAGMGADELIDLVLRVVLERGDVVIDCPPSFGMYPFSTVVNQGKYVAVSRHADFALDCDAIEKAVHDNPQSKVLFLCSPNNPNGSVIADDVLRRLLQLPLLVVLDEAYVEFSAVNGHKSRIDWVLQYDNLIVLRTFSKIAGLAGLRIGYGAFPEWIIPHIMKIKQPYNVNVAANLAALGALADQAWLEQCATKLVEERGRMVQRLAQFEWLRPYPSQSNFVLFRVLNQNAHTLKQQLEQYGILVRYFAKEGVDNCIRISVGKPEDTERLVNALETIST